MQDRNKVADVENGLEDMGRVRVSWDKVREWHGHIYTTKCKIDSLGSSRIAQGDQLGAL